MQTVEFTEVGRNAKSWTARIAESEEAIVREARRGGSLMSSDVWLSAGEFVNHGYIMAGMRPVGKFRIVTETEVAREV
jgi:hypothetical protein